MTRVIALHDVDGLDHAEFSRYKYGARPAVDRFAEALAQRAEPDLLDAPVTVTAPASRAVPIGADLLADGVLRAVNHRRAQRSAAPAVRAKLYRFAVPTTDYGTADEAGRRALLADERISGIPELFSDRDVVVVDDLWVTGLSAEVTIDAIQRWKPRSVTYLVIARMDPAQARRHPQLEFDLNHAAVPSLPALAELCRAGPTTVNQRMCKFVLQHPPAEVRAWLDTVPATVAWHLYAAVLAEGFVQTPRFSATARVLVEFADSHDLDSVAAACGWSLGR
jgi:hypothetical protein